MSKSEKWQEIACPIGFCADKGTAGRFTVNVKR